MICITFYEYKIECKFFERKSIPRHNQNGSFIACMPLINENCNHPLSKDNKYINSELCDEKNEFCPYHQVNKANIR